MCYTDMKMSIRVELELDSQKKNWGRGWIWQPKRHGRGFRRVQGSNTGEALRRAPQNRLEEENLGWITVCTWEQMTSECVVAAGVGRRYRGEN